MKLLLVEDECKLSGALAHILKRSGYSVDTAEDGNTGLEMAATGFYDIIILDRMLPKRNGISLLKELRSLGFDTPVLILTAKDSQNDLVEGLDAGADDYVVKPFSTEELLARLRALSRRKSKDFVGDTITAAGLTLNPLRGEVVKGGSVIHLSVKESLLLDLLMRNLGQVITKERILEKVWGYNSDTDIASVDLYIHYLRKKLCVKNIITVRGIGYYLQGANDVQQASSKTDLN